jgi:hypothetical protein
MLRSAMRSGWVAALAGGLMLASAGVICAQRINPAGAGGDGATPTELDPRAVGVTMAIFLHELGHAVIHQLELPAVGPEEDVADEFASMVFVFNAQNDPKFIEMAKWMPRMEKYLAQRPERKIDKHTWFDEHAPAISRYWNTLCVLYGGIPEGFEEEVTGAFAEEAKKGLADDNDQARWKYRCKAEFKKKYLAWNAILKKHRRNSNPKLPGDQPADAPGGTMYPDYSWLEVSLIGKFAAEFGPVLRESKLFDRVAANISRDYVLPRDVPIYVRECGMYNAWYSPSAQSISMCLDVAEEAIKRLAAAGATGDKPPPLLRPPR